MAAPVKNLTMKRKIQDQTKSAPPTKKMKKNLSAKTKISKDKSDQIPDTKKTKQRKQKQNQQKQDKATANINHIEKRNSTESSEKKPSSSKKWKSWNKLSKKKKKTKLKPKSETNDEPKKNSKRIQIPREISNNWKALHEVLFKDHQTKTPSTKPEKKTQKPKISQLEKINTSSKSTTENDSKVIDIWFDGVDEMLLDIEARKAKRQQEAHLDRVTVNPLVKVGSTDGVTKAVAMDCEMVGVGVKGSDSMLARVSIVNKYGQCIYDKYVKPMENVVDYRTFVSGITPENIKDGEEFFTVQKEVSKIIKGRMLVGHAIHNDLKVLYLQHDKKNIRDTSKYKGYRSLFGFKTPSLKKLTKEVLGVDIQDGEHDSVQDAQAAMRLYTMYRKQWEKDLKIQKKRQRLRRIKACDDQKSI